MTLKWVKNCYVLVSQIGQNLFWEAHWFQLHLTIWIWQPQFQEILTICIHQPQFQTLTWHLPQKEDNHASMYHLNQVITESDTSETYNLTLKIFFICLRIGPLPNVKLGVTLDSWALKLWWNSIANPQISNKPNSKRNISIRKKLTGFTFFTCTFFFPTFHH